jgi:predicted metal-dependent hydrolase
MPNKNFTIDNELPVTVYKRRGNRNLRLSIRADGQIRVSIPSWAPYSAGINFAQSRLEWIRQQQRQPLLLTHGQAIGKAHHLQFVAGQVEKPVSRVRQSLVTVTHPPYIHSNETTVQKVAEAACVRALRSQSESLLPQRLAYLAEKHGFNYRSITIKRLKSRWGSCDQHTNITLSLFLMQLPWELIDYVLLHELAHTKVMRHGPDFWRAMGEILPDVKAHRKAIRQYQPAMSMFRR